MLWKEAIWEENCPLCLDEEFLIKKFNFWNIFKNKYPYKWIKKHILLVPKRHIEHTKYLNNDELLELAKIEQYLEEYFNWENYFSFIRETNKGKSIKHIHYHYISWVIYSDALEEAITKSNK